MYLEHIREIEKLRLRSELLNRKDKALIQMIFEKGSTFDQIARLTGQNPSTISRRFHHLLQKLIAKEFVSLLRGRCGSNGTDIRIVQGYYLQNLSQKAIARKLNISLYRVRNILRAVRSIAYADDADPTRRGRESQGRRTGTKRNRETTYTGGTTECIH
jgi:DNA invertase Pin-like site-specific DNA recombinase